MNCPGCKARCDLQDDLYYCRQCGAQEHKNETIGRYWMRAGKVLEAKELEAKSLKAAKEAYPSGDFKE